MATGKDEGRSLFDIDPIKEEQATAAGSEEKEPAPTFSDIIDNMTEEEAATLLTFSALLGTDNAGEDDVIHALSALEGADGYNPDVIDRAAATLKEMEANDPEGLNKFFEITFSAFIFEYIKAQESEGTAEEKEKKTNTAFSNMMMLMADLDMGTALYNYVRKRTGHAEPTPHITQRGALKGLDIPLDKVNNGLWPELRQSAPNGQLSFKADTTQRGNRRKGKEAIIICSIDFSELEQDENIKFSHTIGEYDKRVYEACGTLWANGYEIASLTQIWHAMGNVGSPSRDQTEKVSKSLNIMQKTSFSINNLQELTVNKGYKRYVYDGHLLPFERVSVYINNTLTDAAIHFLREPPLMEFARGREQLTTIPYNLLTAPISKTNTVIALENYLLEEIAHMKNNPKLERIRLFDTIFGKCGIAGSKKKQRAIDQIETLLKHYQKEKHIEGYSITDRGIEIKL